MEVVTYPASNGGVLGWVETYILIFSYGNTIISIQVLSLKSVSSLAIGPCYEVGWKTTFPTKIKNAETL